MEKNPGSLYRVRFGDCDLLGHLNNARYIDYFLNAREDHIRDHYQIDLRSFYADGLSWVVGSHEILYRKPVLYNEVVYISSSVIKANPDHLLVEMLMKDEQQKQLKAILWTTFVPINVKTGRKEEHPAFFMEFAKKVENSDIQLTGGIRERELAFRQAVVQA